MARQEIHETFWLLKWAVILAVMGAVLAVAVFVQWHLQWRIASPGYYLNFFRELFNNPQYRDGLIQMGLAAIVGALVAGLPPVVFLLKK